jgi:hypothetical protein
MLRHVYDENFDPPSAPDVFLFAASPPATATQKKAETKDQDYRSAATTARTGTRYTQPYEAY